MNTKQSYRGFKATKWDNKTDTQKAKALKNQFEKLGYKIPKYLDKGRISDKQLEKTLNRIEKAYQKRIIKEQPNVKMSDLQYSANKYNKLVDTRLNQLKEQGYSDKAINYIMGKMEFSTLGDRPFFANNSLLEKINLDNFKANKEGRINTLNMIENNYKKLKDKNYIDKVLNSEVNVTTLEEMLNAPLFNNLDDSTKSYLINKFNVLNVVQQEMIIQTTLQEIRDKYPLNEEVGESLATGLGNKILNAINNIVNEI